MTHDAGVNGRCYKARFFTSFRMTNAFSSDLTANFVARIELLAAHYPLLVTFRHDRSIRPHQLDLQGPFAGGVG
jgi:hypothetical protein